MKINDVEIDFLGHSGVLITNSSGKKIAIDPYNVSGNVGKVDVILITHSHYDHCSIADIDKIARQGTVVVIPADAQSKITKVKGIEMQVIEKGDEISIGNWRIEAVPSYNIGKEFHLKEYGYVGYIIKINNVIVYHPGDSDLIPEMQKLTGYGKKETEFVAFLPVSGKYVMDVEEAVNAARTIKPNLVIPIHYGAGVVGSVEDAQLFVERCKEEGINALVLEKI